MDPVVTEALEGELLNGAGTSSAPLASPFLGSGFLADASAPSSLREAPMPGLVSPFAEALALRAVLSPRPHRESPWPSGGPRR
jgi:hypothetical protein